MPRRDGTGPMGMGSKTGRGAGFCTCANAVKYGAGLGMGLGLGLACRRSVAVNNASFKTKKELHLKVIDKQLENL